MIGRIVPGRWRRHRLADTRTVLIPNQWNGSVQQYYHFLLGYLAPIMAWTRRHPERAIAVRDCGPMNRWFDILRPETDLEIMTVGDVLHVLAGDLQPHAVLRGMDFPDRFSTGSIRDFADETRRIAMQRSPEAQGTHSVLVTDRSSSDAFFATTAAEWPESGSQKRSVPNLRTIVDTWADADLLYFDGAQVNMYEQIVMHSTARVLVGQHGAGLTNMIWMQPGSVVVEILPPMPDDAREIFAKLARTLGLRYTLVQQDSVHAAVDPSKLTAAYRQALSALNT